MKMTKPGGATSGLMLAIATVIVITANSAWAAPQDVPSRGFVWKDGAEVYAKICGYCHESNVGPVIRGRDLPAAYIRTIVRNGNRAMPSFRPSEIDDESLAKLAEYISKN
ncbi:cytochrome c [Nitrosospira sp. Nsp13]|jgi:mono/diheme cytochrome c family protein|uniref:c-type cytochrome n=1 Tax=Nitrosospira sp. Nsp13 TaxID=1855332 RepID=UPI000880E6F4|nr:cytochrome c [Nitrosospira sp. Nsp13]SCX83326.1 Cytochrome C oxidase, cbb3-type, subunit III [Nitrosospira sp. Nsp13]